MLVETDMVASYRHCRVGLVVLLVCCIVTPFLLLYTYDVTPEEDEVASISSPNGGGGQTTLRKALDSEKAKTRYENLKEQVDELERIKVSVRNEMRDLEKKRNSVIQETETQKAAYYKLETGIHQGQKRLNVLQADIEKASHKLYAKTPPPNYLKPAPPPIFVITETNPPRPSNDASSSRHNQYKDGGQYNCENDISYCIDFTKCPLSGNLKFHVYQPDSFLPLTVKPKHPELVTDFVAHLKGTNSLAETPDEACLFIVFLGPIEESGRPLSSSTIDFKEIVDNLEYWGRNGRNHVLVNLIDFETKLLLEEFDPLKALVVQNHPNGYHRPGYDISAPAVSSVLTLLSPWKQLPPILPPQRKFLLYFSGETPDRDDFIGHVLKELVSHVKDPVSIVLKCSKSFNMNVKGRHEIGLCGTETERINVLKESVFTLVPMSGFAGLIRLNEALKSGSIPLITGSYPLPFASVIDWKEASINIPVYRLREMHLIMRSIPDYRILELRRQGRFIWETYFSSLSKVLVNVAAILRSRLLHPPPPAEGSIGKSRSFGVDQHQYDSPSFQHNFSIYTHQFWNSPPGPTPMFPNTPWDPAPLSGTAYSEMTDNQFKTLPPHILSAGGITGPYFENYLLGDRPEEYFTVVMLTYRREDVVVEAIERMDKLKFLAKVVVVWNDLEKSPDDVDWPEISVPVEVIQAERNSLNNRFLPYDSIHTEAVLSIDDDVYLRHDEIQFAFRVWRESRDRLVGFPGRFHAFDVHNSKWLYNSNYTCELSMVLTGAAFYHKYYSYLYSNWQPQAVLDMVDSKMNCEDIAMNFLIAHITRKPPLKVTSRWTFHCPNCPDTLSQNNAHFNERHDCVNYLTKIYGYVPLLYTQFRLDSVLFKTRLPSHLEKCYQYV